MHAHTTKSTGWRINIMIWGSASNCKALHWHVLILRKCKIIRCNCVSIATKNVFTHCLAIGRIEEGRVKFEYFAIVVDGLLIVLLLFCKLCLHKYGDYVLLICIDLFSYKSLHLSMFPSLKESIVCCTLAVCPRYITLSCVSIFSLESSNATFYGSSTAQWIILEKRRFRELSSLCSNLKSVLVAKQWWSLWRHIHYFDRLWNIFLSAYLTVFRFDWLWCVRIQLFQLTYGNWYCFFQRNFIVCFYHLSWIISST